MAKAKLPDDIVENENEKERYDFVCSHTREGSGIECGFVSSSWPTPEVAAQRREQHMEEHETGVAMPELIEFERSVGYDREVRQVVAKEDEK